MYERAFALHRSIQEDFTWLRTAAAWLTSAAVPIRLQSTLSGQPINTNRAVIDQRRGVVDRQAELLALCLFDVGSTHVFTATVSCSPYDTKTDTAAARHQPFESKLLCRRGQPRSDTYRYRAQPLCRDEAPVHLQ